jgi:hypothetical protein
MRTAGEQATSDTYVTLKAVGIVTILCDTFWITMKGDRVSVDRVPRTAPSG